MNTKACAHVGAMLATPAIAMAAALTIVGPAAPADAAGTTAVHFCVEKPYNGQWVPAKNVPVSLMSPNISGPKGNSGSGCGVFYNVPAGPSYSVQVQYYPPCPQWGLLGSGPYRPSNLNGPTYMGTVRTKLINMCG